MRRQENYLLGSSGSTGRGRHAGSGNSLALASVAFQDHIMRNLSHDLQATDLTMSSSLHSRSCPQANRGAYKKPKASSVIDTGLKQRNSQKQNSYLTNSGKLQELTFVVQEEKEHVIEEPEERSRGLKAKLSLAEKLGLVPEFTRCDNSNRQKLSEQQWGDVKRQAGERGDYAAACVICKEELGSRKQLITSCSHTFHRSCLEAFERFTGKKCCPMCRKERYEKRLIHEASKIYKTQCATKIQAAWKGHVVRRWYKKLRKIHAPKDPKLRKAFFMEKFDEISQRMLSMYYTDVDSFLREIDSSLENSRKIMASFGEAVSQLESESFWDEICGKAFSRIDNQSECPICMFPLLYDKKLAVCSCTHTFHSQCLRTFEELSLNEVKFCPVCRSNYVSIDK